VAGEAAASYVRGLARSAGEVPEAAFTDEARRQKSINAAVMSADGTENPYVLHREMGELMTAKVGVERDNGTLDAAIAGLAELRERAARIGPHEQSGWANASLPYARQVSDMLVLAEVIATSARERDECRGSHYKPEFEISMPEGKYPGDPEWDDYLARWTENNERWLKTTVAVHTPDGPEISFRSVDTSVFPPETPRDYR
jgi:succinate dehydrogenase / fumarate reductase flavoprotein subunit